MVDPGQLPDISPNTFITLLVLGFAIGAIGHLYRSRPVIALGMLLIVAAVLVLPFLALLSGSLP